jgi:C-terminal processing protease CtpA/Prc
MPGTNPPTFGAQKYAVYTVAPGGPFAYAGKVALVVDGLAYSAADYFPLAVRRATATPLVGSASAGAYGGAGATPSLGGVPEMLANVDPNNCKDASTNASLEGTAVAPDLAVEYEPTDLAQGVDTILEAAVTLLKK